MAEIGGSLSFQSSRITTCCRSSRSPVFFDNSSCTSSLTTRTDRSMICRNLLGMPAFKNLPRWKSLVANNTRGFSMDAIEKVRSVMLESSKQKSIPVFVMMPDDIFQIDPSGATRITNVKAIQVSLHLLKVVGVHGIAVEVWWGLVEHASLKYNWALYEELFRWIDRSGLKLHVALCFHSNKNSTSKIEGSVNLPLWVQKIGFKDRDIYYKDQYGISSYDCLTLGVDDMSVLNGRTALQCYEDFIISFLDKFDSMMGCVIEEVSIGLGPSGELRYPAHPYDDKRWSFPGVGEFQCYDKYMLAKLKVAAWNVGKPEWGDKGPQNAGNYNSYPYGIPFFQNGDENFASHYGHFFLDWYSGSLIRHADAILSKATDLLKKYKSVLLVAKIGLIYWWYQTPSHPAELTAGYYNTSTTDGYDLLASVLLRHGAALHLSCLEMMDEELMPSYFCSPEGLIQQLRDTARKKTLSLTGRNFNERYDKDALEQILFNCYDPAEEALKSFTYFRLGLNMFEPANWRMFVPFLKLMRSFP